MANNDIKAILQAVEALQAEIAELKESLAAVPVGKVTYSLTEMREMGYSERYLQAAYLTPGQDFATKINPAAKNSKIIFNLPKFEAWQKRQIRAQTVGRR